MVKVTALAETFTSGAFKMERSGVSTLTKRSNVASLLHRASSGTKTLPRSCWQPAIYSDRHMCSIRLISPCPQCFSNLSEFCLFPSHQAQKGSPSNGRDHGLLRNLIHLLPRLPTLGRLPGDPPHCRAGQSWV